MAILLLIIVGVILFIAFQIMVDRRNKATGTDAGLEAMQQQLYDAMVTVLPKAASVAPGKQATPQSAQKKGVMQSIIDNAKSWVYGPRPMPAAAQPSNAPTNATPAAPAQNTHGADVADFFGNPGAWFSGGWG